MNLAFRRGTTFFHRADPLSKFAWSLLIAFWIYGIRDLVQVLILNIAVLLLTIIAANLNVKTYLKLSLPMLFGGSFIIVFQGFFQPGEGPIILGIPFSSSGFILGITISLRVFIMVATALAFSTTTSPQDMESALIRLGFPYRLAHILYLALRFIPSFSQDLEGILTVQKNRGIKTSVSSFTKVIISLIFTELRHADDLPAALEIRGFGLHPTRTVLNEVPVTREGIVLLISTIIAIVLQSLYSYF